MSYTPPTYVDTKAQAILALASVVADTDKTALGDGSVNKALDVLADAMAAQDVSVPQTNAGAILALAQYIGGGGGGDFGPCVLIGAKESVPVVDGNAGVSTVIQSLAVDGTTIITTNATDGTEVGSPFAAYVAGGFSVATYWQSDYNTCTPYLVTIGECEGEDEGETYTYLGWKSVELWDGTITKERQTGDFDAYRWLFDVPIMDGNDYGIVLVMSTSS